MSNSNNLNTSINDNDLIIHELNTFTSSAFGELGFNSSIKIKKDKHFDFTPSPNSDGIFIETKQFDYLWEFDMEMDTNENTPLQEVFNNNINHKMDFNDNFTNFNNDFNKQSNLDSQKFNLNSSILNNNHLGKFNLSNQNSIVNNQRKTNLNDEQSNKNK